MGDDIKKKVMSAELTKILVIAGIGLIVLIFLPKILSSLGKAAGSTVTAVGQGLGNTVASVGGGAGSLVSSVGGGIGGFVSGSAAGLPAATHSISQAIGNLNPFAH